MLNKFIKQAESGQAILLVAMIMVILLGATGLAIDGGSLLLQRRDVQNTIDHSILAGTLSLCAGGDGVSAALQAARSTGYDDSFNDILVSVENPPTATYIDPASPAVGSSNYIVVHIERVRDPYFIHLVYQGQLGTSMTGIGYCQPAYQAYANSSFVTLGSDKKAFDLSGTGAVTWCGGGAFAAGGGGDSSNNSGSQQSTGTGCPDPAFSAADTFVDNGGYLTGSGYTVTNNATNPNPNATLDPFSILSPPSCPSPGSTQATEGNITGVQCHTQIDCSSAGADGVVTFTGASAGTQSSVLVLSGDMKSVNCGVQLDNVMLYVNGDVSFTGGKGLGGTAPTVGEWKGFLMWSTGGSISLNGGNTAQLRGTIYAPNANVNVNGNSGLVLEAQIVSDTGNISGSNDSTIVYNEAFFFKIPPQIQVAQ